MRHTRAVFVVIALVVPGALHSQQTVAQRYYAKFICGERPPVAPTVNAWDAVAPGRYYSAINIFNPGADSVRIETFIAPTQATAAPGKQLNGPVVVIPAHRAAEIDCGEILPATQTKFLKGFLRIVATRPVILVGVYTVADSVRAVSIDVESIP